MALHEPFTRRELKQLPVCGAILMSELSKTDENLGRTGCYSSSTLLIDSQ